MRMTGAEIIVHCILEQEIDTVFGIPGGSVLPLFDALSAAQDRLSLVLTAHEQAAAHAADGYARASGLPGVCIATGGPGATNLCTGIAAAYMDSIPMVCLTGNIPSDRMGTDSFQEVDIVGMTIPITKHSFQIKRAEQLLPVLREAFALARTGRPGPVLVDVAVDVQRGSADYTPPEPPPDAARPPVWRAERLIARLAGAKAPLILAGGGCIRAGAESRIAELAERLEAPVITTLMGIGVMPAAHPLNLGFIGIHGCKEANAALARADLLLAVGTRFSERSLGENGVIAGRLPLIHIDIDRAEIGKNVPADSFYVGDCKMILDSILLHAPQQHRKEWLAHLAAAKALSPPKPLSLPERLLRILGGLAGPEALICTDVGQHQMWAAQRIPIEKPGKLITSGGAGAMGFGLGAAIGAQCARPEKRVVLVTGDGSFRMNAMELATVARYNLPIITVVLNNSGLGMVRQLQTQFYDGRHFACDLGGAPDYITLATAFGLDAADVKTEAEFATAAGMALEARRAMVVHCRIPADAAVRPAPGRKHADTIVD